VHARIDVRPYYDVKQRASACHRRQGGPGEAFRWLPGFIVSAACSGFETFKQGNPPPLAGREAPPRPV